jgi:phosphoserine phosphatase
MKRKFLLAAFDMDGTILEHESSWAAIHRHFKTEKSSATSLKLYGEGRIDYREFMRRDIASWPQGLTRAEIDSILGGYIVREDAAATLEELRRKGIKTALVTSGIDILAEKVSEELGFDCYVANGLKFDRSGRVKPRGVGRVDPRRKDLAYRKLLTGLGILPKQTIAVGDTIYDLQFLKSAGLGFMLAHTTRVDDPQIIHIQSLSEILHYL